MNKKQVQVDLLETLMTDLHKLRDETEARERREEQKFKREHRRIQAKVAAEISEARACGFPWTVYRPFHSNLEAVGAAYCSSCMGRGKSRSSARRAEYVSYSTHIEGRTVQCVWCYTGLGPIRDKLTDLMKETLLGSYDEAGQPTAPVGKNTFVGLLRRGLVSSEGLTAKGKTVRRLLQSETKE